MPTGRLQRLLLVAMVLSSLCNPLLLLLLLVQLRLLLHPLQSPLQLQLSPPR